MADLHRIDRADGIFTVAELDYENAYYAAMLDGDPYAYLQTQIVPGYDFALLHITLLSFSRRVLRECLADYRTLNKILKASGIKLMVHLKEAPFCKWEKLMHVLGFHTPKDISIQGKHYKTVRMEVF